MKKLIPVLILVLFLASCSYDKEDPGANACITDPKYSTDVKPFMDVTCAKAGCHAAPGNGPGQLTTYQEVYDAKDLINNAVSSGLMPKDAKLSADQKNIILCWIANGALNN